MAAGFRILLFVWAITIIAGCDNPTDSVKPVVDSTLRITLSADKMSGPAPLTVTFYGTMYGDTSSYIGHVPDYCLSTPSSFTTVVRILPDTTQPLKMTWTSEKTLQHPGQYKFFLQYIGIKNGSNLYLTSDTLTITVN